MQRFEGRVALVTGAGRGIGFAIAATSERSSPASCTTSPSMRDGAVPHARAAAWFPTWSPMRLTHSVRVAPVQAARRCAAPVDPSALHTRRGEAAPGLRQRTG